jgi:hypothetical protein
LILTVVTKFVVFNDAASSSDYRASNDSIIKRITNWKGYGIKRPWPILRYYPVTFLEGLRKTTKTLSGEPVAGP